jgi:hypothetical protein
MEPMFDEDSFLDEIDSKEQAAACTDYLAHNEWAFRKELRNQGLSHEEEENKIGQVWTNLVKSCRRVGYSSDRIKQKSEQFGIK